MKRTLNLKKKNLQQQFYFNNKNKIGWTGLLIYLFLQCHLAYATKYEAENAHLIGVSIDNSEAGFSGTGHTTANTFNNSSDKIIFTINVTSAGNYPLTIRYKNSGSIEKYQHISINGGDNQYTHFPASTSWANLNVGNIALQNGNNTIEISKSWGWTNIDYIIVDNINSNECNGTNYYVAPNGSDSNPGTIAQPFASMFKAGRVAKAGDVVIFEDGNYIEPKRVDFKTNGGTKDCPIIIKARNKHGAKIVFTTGYQKAQSIWISKPWITIEGFDLSKEVRGTTTSNQIIRIYGDTITQNGITDIRQGHYCTVRGNRIHHAYEEGVKSYQTKGLLVEDNIIYDFINEGIDFVDVDDAIIRNNEIYQVTRMGILGGKGGSKNIQVYNNYVHINNEMPVAGYGISLGGSGTRTGISCSNSIVYNNVIVSENSDYMYAGLAMFGTVNCAYYNNIVIGAKHGFYSRTFDDTPANLNPVFKNNIIVNTTRNSYFHWNGTLDGTEDFDQNLFFNTPNSPNEPNSIYADPQFKDIKSDWHLLPTSPAIDAGTDFLFSRFSGEQINLNFDWDGKKRDATWDMGIYEQTRTSNPNEGLQRYEAENAHLIAVSTGNSLAGFSGAGYTTANTFENAGDKIIFNVNVATAGDYALTIRYQNIQNVEKYQYIKINGGNQKFTHFPASASWRNLNFGNITLNAGNNTIEISKGYGWTHFDYIELGGSNTLPDSDLVTPNPTAETIKLWEYLKSVPEQGKVLSGVWSQKDGQQDIFNSSGKFAAILGFDLWCWHPYDDPVCGRVQQNEVIDAAINHAKKGGIVQLNWHWGNPFANSFNGSNAWVSQAGELSNAQWNNLVTPGTFEYNIIITEIDKHANDVLKLIKYNSGKSIPILFRPLHEIDGGWFWWTNKNAPSKTVALWNIIFNRLTYHHKLNNLIWVWNSSEAAKSAQVSGQFYPGDNKADILATDIYTIDYQQSGVRDETWSGGIDLTYKDFYDILQEISPNKPKALGECDALPNPDKIQNGSANFDVSWVYALAWWTPLDGSRASCNTSPCNPSSWINYTYNHNLYVSLDELPGFSNKEANPETTNSLHLSNYPNPFNKQTRIAFTLTEDSDVTLYIADVTGKQIQVMLNNEMMRAGENTFTFDANAYPSGMYYYSIKTPKHSITQKMLIAK